MPPQKTVIKSIACPCGSNKSYAQCCEPLHNGSPANNAESLMRSRYSAFVIGLPDYIHHSWHHSTRPLNTLESDDANSAMQWIGLQIRRHEAIDDIHAIVEFIARYKIHGKAYRLHETSRFVLENNHWFYVDGEILKR